MSSAHGYGLTCLVSAGMLALSAPPAVGQSPRRPSLRPVPVSDHRPFQPFSSAAPALPYQSRAGRSATRTILTHALVGAGAGVLTGWALSGANLSDDDTSVVLVWTSVGAFAGIVSGVVTWLTADIE